MTERSTAPFDAWLSLAEEWVKQDRDKPIEALIVRYIADREDSDRGWGDLPDHIRSRFDSCHRTMKKVSQREVLEIAIRGDLTNWDQLFRYFDRDSASYLNCEPKEYLDRLDPVERWVIKLLYAVRNGIASDAHEGKRYILDPRFKGSFKTGQSERKFIAVCIDRCTVPGLADRLSESAESYGFYARIADLRLVSIDLIRWIRERIFESEQQQPRSSVTADSEARKWRRRQAGKDKMEDWQRVPQWADNPSHFWHESDVRRAGDWWRRVHPRAFTAKGREGYVLIDPSQVRCVANQEYWVFFSDGGGIECIERQSLIIQDQRAVVLIEEYDQALDYSGKGPDHDGWDMPRCFELTRDQVHEWWSVHFSQSPDDLMSLCFVGPNGAQPLSESEQQQPLSTFTPEQKQYAIAGACWDWVRDQQVADNKPKRRETAFPIAVSNGYKPEGETREKQIARFKQHAKDGLKGPYLNLSQAIKGEMRFPSKLSYDGKG